MLLHVINLALYDHFPEFKKLKKQSLTSSSNYTMFPLEQTLQLSATLTVSRNTSSPELTDLFCSTLPYLPLSFHSLLTSYPWMDVPYFSDPSLSLIVTELLQSSSSYLHHLSTTPEQHLHFFTSIFSLPCIFHLVSFLGYDTSSDLLKKLDTSEFFSSLILNKQREVFLTVDSLAAKVFGLDLESPSVGGFFYETMLTLSSLNMLCSGSVVFRELISTNLNIIEVLNVLIDSISLLKTKNLCNFSNFMALLNSEFNSLKQAVSDHTFSLDQSYLDKQDQIQIKSISLRLAKEYDDEYDDSLDDLAITQSSLIEEVVEVEDVEEKKSDEKHMEPSSSKRKFHKKRQSRKRS
ncbi:hypothetical protein GEMRC1_010704 [Eukaryota sp. GEM-RC1]